MARIRSLGDGLHRAIIGAGVIFGDPHDQRGDDQADEHAVEQCRTGEAAFNAGNLEGFAGHRAISADHGVHVGEDGLGGEPQRRHGEHAGDDQALVERAHDGAAAKADEIGADDGGDDADAASEQRQGHQLGRITAGDEQGAQHHGGADGDHVGFEQIGRHAGAIADVVAHVIGDHAGVAIIIFIKAELVLADHVGAHIGRLGEDAAAQTGEDGDERGTERQRDQRVDDGAAGGLKARRHQRIEITSDGEQREAGNEHAGHGARTERHGEAGLQRLARGFGGAHVGAHRNVHADEAGGTGEHGAEHEGNGGDDTQEPGDQARDDDADDGDGGILLGEIGTGADLDGFRDFLHAGIARRGAEHLPRGDHSIDHCGYPADDGQNNAIHWSPSPCLYPTRIHGLGNLPHHGMGFDERKRAGRDYRAKR